MEGPGAGQFSKHPGAEEDEPVYEEDVGEIDPTRLAQSETPGKQWDEGTFAPVGGAVHELRVALVVEWIVGAEAVELAVVAQRCGVLECRTLQFRRQLPRVARIEQARPIAGEPALSYRVLPEQGGEERHRSPDPTLPAPIHSVYFP